MTDRKKTRQKRLIAGMGTVIIIVLGLALLTGVEVRRENGWICGQCGARRHETVWAWGGRSSTGIDLSVLGQRLSARDGGHAHTWHKIQGTGRDVYGRSVRWGHGPAPPILGIPKELLDKFAAAATDTELNELVRIVTAETSDEQEQLIDRLVTEVTTRGN